MITDNIIKGKSRKTRAQRQGRLRTNKRGAGCSDLRSWTFGKGPWWIDRIYSSTAGFLGEERFGLASQLRRSSISGAANIAEGSGHTSDTEFAHFAEIAYGSFLASVAELEIAKREQFLKAEIFETTYRKADDQAKMLSDFRRRAKGNLSAFSS